VKRYFGKNWAIALAACLQMQHYDVTLATGEDVGLNLALLMKLFRKHAPLILICHNIASRRRAFLLGKLRIGTAIKKFLCLSQAQVDMLTERYGIKQAQIEVIYWHVDHQFFQPQASESTKRQICSAGTASRDYATLLQAVQDLDVAVKVAASSTWFPQQLNISLDAIPGHVEVRDYGTYHALRQLYADSLFVVVPLLNVDFSAGYSVILEAMAMGKAVIVSKIRQRDDFIVDGWNGFYVTPGNVVELRDRIDFLLQNPDEARRLGQNARKSIEERYTLEHFVERVRNAGLAL
jgi:glycosyltransferase involved in cell wall biosynthesis